MLTNLFHAATSFICAVQYRWTFYTSSSSECQMPSVVDDEITS